MQHWVEHLGPPILFLLVLVQQAGVPYPITPILIVAGAVSVHGHVHAAAVIGIAAGAAVLADLAWYTAGYRLGGRALKALCALSLSPDSCVSETERWFGRFGTRVLVVAKFVPGLGLVSTAMAGVVRASLEGFFLYDVIGNVLWASAAVCLGIIFHDAVGDVLNTLAEFGYWGVALVIAAVAAFVAVRLLKRRALIRELRSSRISVSELKELVDRGPVPVIIDALAPASRQREGVIPGAIPVETLQLDSDPAAVPFDAEVIVYCACPNEASAARIAQQLIRMGCLRVRPLTGGIFAWKDAGFGVETVPVPVTAAAPRAAI
ncbi:MAG TPA: DedA family protein/thiosulfate sulfurtransferase GlpE [Steroidobacteraceae bacterium]|jgi:membrane protein DedA with SNARE-associated domain/rhodanese-related sulfurtransferase